MRYIMLVPALLAIFIVPQAAAQNVTISIGSGRSPVASGINGTATFAPEDNSAYGEFTVQSEQAWLILGKNFGKRTVMTLGGSTGYFQDAPWIGPYLAFASPAVYGAKFSALIWPIAFAQEPETWRLDGVENLEQLKTGNFAQAAVSFWRFRLSYAWLDFLDQPFNRLPGGSYTMPLTRDVDLSASVTRNTNAERWMFYMGATWTLRKSE